MRIFGIDPAPGKKSVLYDGEYFLHLDYKELKDFIFSQRDLLICWDAPLGVDSEYSLTMKVSEREIRNRYKLPPGINVLPYATCPHWTISQYIFALPNICGCEPKAKLLTSKEQNFQAINLIEVHPALTMWLWLQNKNLNWQYKGNRVKKAEAMKRIDMILDALQEKFQQLTFPQIASDDELDAFVAWLLGYLYLYEPQKVEFVGSSKDAILIPAV